MIPLPWRGRAKQRTSDRRRARQELADRLGGQLLKGKRDTADVVVVEHGPWTVRLDTYVVSTGYTTVIHTRVRCLAHRRQAFGLVVRPRTALDRLAEALGFRGMPGGDRDFRARYVATGKPAPVLRALLASSLPEAFRARDALRLDVKKASRKERRSWGADTVALSVQTLGILTDVDALAALFEVATVAVEEMARTGVVEALEGPSLSRSVSPGPDRG